jgi:hypothetical protein
MSKDRTGEDVDNEVVLDEFGNPIEHERTVYKTKRVRRFIDGDTIAEFAKTLAPVKKKLKKRNPWDPP